jgi:hypothetical protein
MMLVFSIVSKMLILTYNVLLVEETGVPEKTTDLPQVTDKLSHNVVSSTLLHELDSNSQQKLFILHDSKIVMHRISALKKRTDGHEESLKIPEWWSEA